MRFLFFVLFLTTHVCFAQSSDPFQAALDAFESEDFEQAQVLFDALFDDRKDAESAFYLGRIELENNKSADAIKWLEIAVEKNDQDAEYHYWLSESYFRRIDEVGMMKKLGLAKKGKRAAERSVELDPAHPDARTSLIYFYTQAPNMAGGSKEKALEQAEILRTHHPVRGRMMLAMVYSSQEEYEKADAEYVALLDEFANDAEVQYAAGMYFQGRKRFDEAIDLFQKATDIKPTHYSALYQIGRTVVFADKWHDTGIDALNQYLKADLPDDVPPHASAWWRLGMIHELAGNDGDARAAYESALEEEPGHKEAKKALNELDS